MKFSGYSRGYDHRVPNPAMPGEFYAEVSYRCADGFDFENMERSVNSRSDEKFNKLYCSEGRWEGRIPECLEVEEIDNNEDLASNCPDEEEKRLNCDHACVLKPQEGNAEPVVTCECHVGYTLSSEDGRTCLGIQFSLPFKNSLCLPFKIWIELSQPQKTTFQCVLYL